MPHEYKEQQNKTESSAPAQKNRSKKIIKSKRFLISLGIIAFAIFIIFEILQPAIYLNQDQVACGVTVLENKYSGELKPDNRSCFCLGKMRSLKTNNIGIDRVDYCEGVGISTINLKHSETE